MHSFVLCCLNGHGHGHEHLPTLQQMKSLIRIHSQIFSWHWLQGGIRCPALRPYEITPLSSVKGDNVNFSCVNTSTSHFPEYNVQCHTIHHQHHVPSSHPSRPHVHSTLISSFLLPLYFPDSSPHRLLCFSFPLRTLKIYPSPPPHILTPLSPCPSSLPPSLSQPAPSLSPFLVTLRGEPKKLQAI